MPWMTSLSAAANFGSSTPRRATRPMMTVRMRSSVGTGFGAGFGAGAAAAAWTTTARRTGAIISTCSARSGAKTRPLIRISVKGDMPDEDDDDLVQRHLLERDGTEGGRE